MWRRKSATRELFRVARYELCADGSHEIYRHSCRTYNPFASWRFMQSCWRLPPLCHSRVSSLPHISKWTRACRVLLAGLDLLYRGVIQSVDEDMAHPRPQGATRFWPWAREELSPRVGYNPRASCRRPTTLIAGPWPAGEIHASFVVVRLGGAAAGNTLIRGSCSHQPHP